MKYNRVNTTWTFSVAIAGLALSVLTPVAHGHGNNPQDTSDTAPHGDPPPVPPPASGPQIDVTVAPALVPHVSDSILDPGIVIGIDITGPDAFNLLSQMVSEPADVSTIVFAAEDLMPSLDVGFSAGSGSGSISVPASGVIPAPGALVLLGLAAASAGRRRRRH